MEELEVTFRSSPIHVGVELLQALDCCSNVFSFVRAGAVSVVYRVIISRGGSKGGEQVRETFRVRDQSGTIGIITAANNWQQ